MLKKFSSDLKQLLKDASLSGLVASFIVVIVGMTSSAVLVFQAAESVGLSPQAAGSWLGSICIIIGLLSIGLSFYHKTPVVMAWSTAGAALLVTSLVDVPLSDAIGAFVFSALLIFLCGITGIFEKLMNRIPITIASALLAGVLLHFALDTFVAITKQPILIGVMLVTYLVSKRFSPRLTMLMVLITGTLTASLIGELHFENVQITLTQFYFTLPTFSASALLSIGIPLFVITMTTQNLTGITVMRANGYKTPLSPLLTWSGAANIIGAFWGCFAVNLAAITAAIAMGPEAHRNPKKRYFAALMSGFIYLILGLMAGTVTSIFAAFPKEMVVAIAGFALLSTILSCLQTAFSKDNEKEAAFLTFIITASGVTIFGVSSAFWGLIVGGVVQFIFREKKDT